MPNPTDIENYTFQVAVIQADGQMPTIYCGDGADGLAFAMVYASIDAPSIVSITVRYVPEIPLTLWDWDDTTLPVDTENYTWIVVFDCDLVTGDHWQTAGYLMGDGAEMYTNIRAGAEYARLMESDQQNAELFEHQRNYRMGYTPLITGWTNWEGTNS
ncbi:MAG TPA: hypothetical protein VJ777_12695 [Mycobacterium sp.]|nr:hypothetical protein [Mycobacterium sp.]